MPIHDHDADRDHETNQRSSRRTLDTSDPGGPAGRLLGIQRSAGNQAAISFLGRAPTVQRDDELEEFGQDVSAGTAQDSAEELQARPAARTQEQARAMVDAHVEPKRCFIELENSRVGWRAIPGTGCAHWVAHQRGGPTGTARVCQDGFKYRVTELLASLHQASSDLSAAQPGSVWSAAGSSHVGIVRSVTRDPTSNAVTAVEVENDSSASGGVVRQTKTDGSIYG